MFPNNLYLRAAGCIRETWRQAVGSATQQLDSVLNQIEQQFRALQEVVAQFNQTQLSESPIAEPSLPQEIQGLAQLLRDSGNQLLEKLASQPPAIPSIQFLAEELRQLDADFGGLCIDWNGKAITVDTEPIVLEDIYLGSFSIRFYWERLAQSFDYHCFDVVALNPNPASANDEVTHPHVKADQICAGEATASLHNALEQGRLGDAFSPILGVLSTYNSASPFVALESWEGTRCQDCDYVVSDDDICYCAGCDQNLCCDCARTCAACRSTRCETCLQVCAVCDSCCCAACIEETAGSHRNCCKDCRRNCPVCLDDFAADELLEGIDLCPSCRESKPVECDLSETPTVDPGPLPIITTPEISDDDSLESFAAAVAPL